MSTIGSSLSKGADGTALINQSVLGQLAGIAKDFSRLAFDTAVAAERTNITNNGVGIWSNGEKVSIFGEIGTRIWFVGGSAAASHARNVLYIGKTYALASDTNIFGATSGAPSSGTGANGDYLVDGAAGLLYGPKAGGFWPAGVSLGGAASGSVTWLIAKDLGVKGDGTTDDTAAINAAWATALSGNHGLDFPVGHYKVSGTLHFGGGTGGHVRLRGYPGETFLDSVAVPVACTASISGTTLTVTAIASGGTQLGVGCIVNVPGGTRCSIRSQLSGAAGGTGTYLLDVSQTIASNAGFTVGCPIVLIGNGVGVDGFVGGKVEGINVTSSGTGAMTSGAIGFCSAGITNVEYDLCVASGMMIGFDAVENCFGTTWNNCQSGSGGTCQVGINIRSGATGGAGNQVKVNNGWMTGKVAGASVSPNSDGIIFSGGQLGCTSSDGSDNVGPVIWGKDFVTGALGNLGELSILQVDMEQYDGWALRGFGQVNLDVQSCPFISRSVNGGGQKSIGVLKCDNAANMRLTIERSDLAGDFSALKPVVINGYGGGSYYERGSLIENVTFASAAQVPSQSQSLFEISTLATGIAIFHDYVSGKDCIYANGVRTVPIATADVSTLTAATLTGAFKAVVYDGTGAEFFATMDGLAAYVVKKVEAPQSVAYAATINIDASAGRTVLVGALTGPVTIANPTNLTDGQTVVIRLVQDATGGRVATWGNMFRFEGGTSALSTGANAIDRFVGQYLAGPGTIAGSLKLGFG
jgi:hypothetical protein